MKNIFTYPNNAASHYIDPDYVGDATVGFEKRITDLKNGNFKAWDGTAPVATVDHIMENISKFNHYYDSRGDVNVTMTDMYQYPLLTGTVTVTAGNDITALVTNANTADPAVVTSAGHGFSDGMQVVISNFNGSWAQFNGQTFYVDVQTVDTFYLCFDQALTNPLGFGTYYSNQDIVQFDLTTSPIQVIPNAANPVPLDGSEITFTAGTEAGNIIDSLISTYYTKMNAGNIELYEDVALTNPLNYADVNWTNTELTLEAYWNTSPDSLRLTISDPVMDPGEPFVKIRSLINGAYHDGMYGVIDAVDTDTLYYHNINGQIFTDSGLTTALDDSNYYGEIKYCNVSSQHDGWFHFPLRDDGDNITFNAVGSGYFTLDQTMIDVTKIDDGNVLSKHFLAWGWDPTTNTSSATNHPIAFTDSGYTLNGDKIYSLDGHTFESTATPTATYYNHIAPGNANTYGVVTAGENRIYLQTDKAIGSHLKTLLEGANPLTAQYPIIVEAKDGVTSNFIMLTPMYVANNGNSVACLCYDINDTTAEIDLFGTISPISGTAVVNTDFHTYKQGIRITDDSVGSDVTLTAVETGNFDTDNAFVIPTTCPHNLQPGDIISLYGSDFVVYPSGAFEGLPVWRYYPITLPVATANDIDFTYNVDLMNLNGDTITTFTTRYDSYIPVTSDLHEQHAVVIPVDNHEFIKTESVKLIPMENNVDGTYDINQITTDSTQGTVFYDDPDTYALSSIELVIPGNSTYTYLDTNGDPQPGALVDTLYISAGATTSATLPGTPNITLTTDVNGRLTGATLNSDLTGFAGPGEICMTVTSFADQYVPPAPDLAALEDIFDTADEWATTDADSAKQWGKDIIPTTAKVTYDQPSTVNKSQSGYKYTRTGGFIKTTLELTYNNLTKDDFQVLHAHAQAAKGQAIPFYLVHSEWGNKVLSFDNPKSTGVPRFIEDVTVGDTILKFGGFESNETEAFKQGEIIIIGGPARGNGYITTVLNTVDANVYGEAHVRIPHPAQTTRETAYPAWKNPYWIVATLDSDSFQYSIDTFGHYSVSVDFELGNWVS